MSILHLDNDRTIDTNDRFIVAGYGGVAWYVVGLEYETVYDYEWNDEFGCEDEIAIERMTGMVRAIMVGDDRVELIDPDDLVVIDEDDYCHGCGQIGCGHDGR